MSYNESLRADSNYPPMSQSDWDNEIWKPCPNFENKYLISNKGHIKSIGTYNSCKTNKLLKLYKKKGRNGYLQVRLYDNNRAKTVEIHTLVAKAFISNPNNFKCINHLNGDKTDNNVENLEWCSRIDNLYDSYSTMSSTRNFCVCDLYKEDTMELIGTFKSIKEASEYAFNHFGCSLSGMIKNYHSKGYKLVKKSVETKMDE